MCVCMCLYLWPSLAQMDEAKAWLAKAGAPPSGVGAWLVDYHTGVAQFVQGAFRAPAISWPRNSLATVM